MGAVTQYCCKSKKGEDGESDVELTALACKQKGNVMFKAGSFEDAAKHYEEGLKLDSKNVAILSNLSACYFKLKKYTAAIREADKCI